MILALARSSTRRTSPSATAQSAAVLGSIRNIASYLFNGQLLVGRSLTVAALNSNRSLTVAVRKCLFLLVECVHGLRGALVQPALHGFAGPPDGRFDPVALFRGRERTEQKTCHVAVRRPADA